MKGGFYPRIAWTGIRKNSRLYTPYILICIGMVMMYYIISFLNTSKILHDMSGGAVIQEMLGLGTGVISVFAVIFLFYTNSFLIRRRKKEFGLYNILGMGKRHLALILIWETLIIAVFALGGGLVFGIAFSKFAELAMINILHENVNFVLSVAPGSIGKTLEVFSVIFLLLLINTLRQIQLSNPIELLHSEHAGEKPPKANWILAAVGAVILCTAYYLAVTIEDPVQALLMFFVAVIMVIIATYLLFIAGSVVICRILQKNKNYYYKTNHFVSVSSMVYRMKRNGAGLASICILCTMVLVMLSSTVCLYIGMEDIIRNRYPRNLNLDVTVENASCLENEETEEVRRLVDQLAEKNGYTRENVLDYRLTDTIGYVKDDQMLVGDAAMGEDHPNSYANIWQIFMISLEDYNQLMDQNETLEPGEVLIYTPKKAYNGDTVVMDSANPLKVKKTVTDFVDNGVDMAQIVPSMYIFFSDYYNILEAIEQTQDPESDEALGYHWLYAFDIDCSDKKQIEFQEQVENKLEEKGLKESEGDSEIKSITLEGDAKSRASFYALYGGLFFLGILLGVVFVFAAVLIMYYKQVSEGYEDQSRFEIMQKVGMTKRDIRKSINSQVLLVFFLPLLAAGMHLAFAFPMIQKLLLAFGLTNMNLFTWVTIICYLVFAVFYIIVYHITSRSYYNIVSGVKE